MTTQRAIVDELARAAAAGQSVVLATVVRVVGSSYGGVGARMLVRVDGSTVGLVSGGCLESDLAAHARRLHATGCAEVVTYDTRADDDGVWGLGLGCNGLIDVLLEPLLPASAAALASLLGLALGAGTPSVLATVVHVDAPAPGAPAVGAHALTFAPVTPTPSPALGAGPAGTSYKRWATGATAARSRRWQRTRTRRGPPDGAGSCASTAPCAWHSRSCTRASGS